MQVANFKPRANLRVSIAAAILPRRPVLVYRPKGSAGRGQDGGDDGISAFMEMEILTAG